MSVQVAGQEPGQLPASDNPEGMPAVPAVPSARKAYAFVAVLVGVIGLLVGFANLDRVQMWASEYGRAWVYLGFFLYASVFGRLFWWGTDTLVTALTTRQSAHAGMDEGGR